MTATTATTHNGNIRRGRGVVHLPYARNPQPTATYSTVPNCAPAGVSREWTITQESVTCARCLRTIGDAYDAADKHNRSLPVALPVPAAAPVDAAPADDAEVSTFELPDGIVDAADDDTDNWVREASLGRGTYRLEFSRISAPHADLPLVLTVDTHGLDPVTLPAPVRQALAPEEGRLAALLTAGVVAHMAPQMPAPWWTPEGHDDSTPVLTVAWEHHKPGSDAFASLYAGRYVGNLARLVGTVTVHRMHAHNLPVCDCGHPAEGHQAPGGLQGNCLDLERPADQMNRARTGRCECAGYWPLANGREVNHAVRAWRFASDEGRPISHGLARFVVAALVDPGKLDPAGAELARAFVAQGVVPLEAGDMLMHLFPNALGINAATDSNLVTGLREYLEHHGPRFAVVDPRDNTPWHDMWI